MLIEYRKEDFGAPVPDDHKMSLQEIKTEVEPEGFKFDKVIGVLPQRHVVIFSNVRGR